MMIRVTDPTDPIRCKGSVGHEQCWNRAVTGSEFCEAHHGRDKLPAMNMRQYLLAEANQTRLTQFADSHSIKSLRNEIGMAKMLNERILNMALASDTEVLQRSHQVNRLLLVTARLQRTSVALERSLSGLLSKHTVLGFAYGAIEVLANRLQGLPNYEPLVRSMSAEIIEVIKNARNPETDAASAELYGEKATLALVCRPDAPPVEEQCQYLLAEAKDRTRLAHFAEHESVKSLRDEIAISRILTERIYNTIKNDNDLLNRAGQLTEQILITEQLVKSSHVIDQQYGAVLSDEASSRLCQSLLQIIMLGIRGIDNHHQIVDAVVLDLKDLARTIEATGDLPN